MEFLVKLNKFCHQLLRSPSQALTQAQYFILRRLPSANSANIKRILEKTPLILQVETTNICNAACVFCPYPRMKRKKGFMEPALFDKVVHDYKELGGGPVSLTPIMGDPLLDPHLIERVRTLKSFTEISQITLTTNAIALDKYNDVDVSYLLENLDSIAISVGGLDPETYKRMYGIDKFHQVYQGIERILRLSASLEKSANIHLAFRTSDPDFQKRHKAQLDEYSRRGAFISHLSQYENYGGAIESATSKNIAVKKGKTKIRPCAFASISMCVCWDGRLGACGCADFEGELQLGNVRDQSLASIWSGGKRKLILESFLCKGNQLPACIECSAYQPDSIFSYPFFKKLKAHGPLPIEFYQQFWGG